MSDKKIKKPTFFVDREPGSFFATHKGSKKRVSTNILKFSKLYGRLNFAHKVLISVVLGLFMCFVTLFFAESTGLYTGGTSAALQGIARIVRTSLYKSNNLPTGQIELIYQLLYWGQYLALNVGLFFLAWKKIGHQFAVLSLIYLVVLQVSGFCFQQIPALKHISWFGETKTINDVLQGYQVKSLIFYNKWLPSLVSVNPTTVDWTKLVIRSDADLLVVRSIDASSITRIFSLFIYCLLYACFAGIVDALLLISGGSAAGSAIISTYFGEVKNKNVGTILAIINVVGLFFGVILGTYVSGIIVDSRYAGIEYFLSGNLVCSIICAIVNGLVLNALFPWRKMVKVEIFTTNWTPIKKYLSSIHAPFEMSEVEATGAQKGTKLKIIISIQQLIIVPRLVKYVRGIDKKCLISATYVNDIDGNINLLRQATNRGLTIKKEQ